MRIKSKFKIRKYVIAQKNLRIETKMNVCKTKWINSLKFSKTKTEFCKGIYEKTEIKST